MNKPLLAFTGLVLTNLFWAGNAILARAVVDDIPPLTLSFWRWLIAFVLILPFGLHHIVQQQREIRCNIKLLCLLAVLSITIYNSVLYLSAHTTTAINITLVSATLPFITLLLAWFIIKQIPNHWQWAGIILSLSGVFIIISRANWQTIVGLSFSNGDILILGIVFCWALYSVLLRKYPIKIHPVGLLTVLIALGTLFILPFYLMEVSVLGAFTMQVEYFFVFAYIGIFPSLLAYLFWNYSISIVGPNMAALSNYLMPVFAALIAIPLLGEQLHLFHFLGGSLVLLGLYLANVIGGNNKV